MILLLSSGINSNAGSSLRVRFRLPLLTLERDGREVVLSERSYVLRMCVELTTIGYVLSNRYALTGRSADIRSAAAYICTWRLY